MKTQLIDFIWRCLLPIIHHALLLFIFIQESQAMKFWYLFIIYATDINYLTVQITGRLFDCITKLGYWYLRLLR